MSKKSDNLRLFPVVLVAILFLLAFKLGAAMLGTGNYFTAVAPAAAAEEKKKPKETAKPNKETSTKVVGTKRKENIARTPQSTTEVKILQRLAERRQELDARAKELDLRINLIKAAEGRVEQKIEELKKLSAQFQKAFNERESKQAAKLKSLVSMYENMKPKDAARIFNVLDASILIDVAGQMRTRKMAPVLALMTSAAAERLTVALAIRARGRVKTPTKPGLPGVRPNNAG